MLYLGIILDSKADNCCVNSYLLQKSKVSVKTVILSENISNFNKFLVWFTWID